MSSAVCGETSEESLHLGGAGGELYLTDPVQVPQPQTDSKQFSLRGDEVICRIRAREEREKRAQDGWRRGKLPRPLREPGRQPQEEEEDEHQLKLVQQQRHGPADGRDASRRWSPRRSWRPR